MSDQRITIDVDINGHIKGFNQAIQQANSVLTKMPLIKDNPLAKALEKAKAAMGDLNKIASKGISSASDKNALTRAYGNVEKAIQNVIKAQEDMAKMPLKDFRKLIDENLISGFEDAKKAIEEYKGAYENLAKQRQSINGKQGAETRRQKQIATLEAKDNRTEAETKKLEELRDKSEKAKIEIEQLKLALEGDLNNVLNSLKQKLSDLGIDTTGITDVKTALAAVEDQLVDTEKIVEESQISFQNANFSIEELVKTLEDAGYTVTKAGDDFERAKDQLNLSNTIANNIKNFFSLTNAINLFRRAVQSSFNTVKELDAVMTETAVVTDFSVSDMWDKLPEYTKMANELGATTKGAYETATLYYQQGLKTNEVMAVSAETMKMARIAGLDYATATDYMTAALRGFNMEINTDSAQRVNDVYSRLAAITASNTQEISVAMTKVASLAHNANMEFETTAAFLAQIIETTRESAETAGTALKTVVARFTEVKKLYNEGELMGTDEEGEEIDVNKVATALRSAGIDMNKYFTGQVGLDDIFMELASKWDSLDKVQQRYIATMAAGSRQQSRFIAMMSNYKRTLELVGEAQNSAGAGQKQFDKTMESLEAKLNRLKNAWDTFLMSIANSDAIKWVVDLLTNLITKLNEFITSVSGENGLIKFFATMGTVLGSGALLKGGLKALSGGLAAILGTGKDKKVGFFDALLFGGKSLEEYKSKVEEIAGKINGISFSSLKANLTEVIGTTNAATTATEVAGKAALEAGAEAKVGGEMAAAGATGFAKLWMNLAPILGGILIGAVIIGSIVAIGKAIKEATHPLETAQKQAQKLQNQFEETRDKIKETNTALDELEEKFKDAEQFSNLPATFAEKMELANESLKEFIKLFPEFAKYYDPNTGTFNFEAAKNQVANEEAANNEVGQKADLTQLIGAYNQNALEKTEESYNALMYYLDQYNKDYGLGLTVEDLGRIYNEAYNAAIQNHTYADEQGEYFDAAGAKAETIEVVMRVVQEQAKENINFVGQNGAANETVSSIYDARLQSFDNDLQKQQFQQYIGKVSNAGYGIDQQTMTNVSDLINNGSIEFQGDTITSIEQYIAALQKLMEVEASDTENTQKLTDSLDNLNETYPDTGKAVEYTNEEIEESAKHWKKEQKEVIEITNSIEDYRKQLAGMDKDSSEYEETLGEMTETLQNYFNGEINQEGLEDEINSFIEKAAKQLANGEIEFKDVGKNLAISLASGLENGADSITFNSLIDKLSNLKAGAAVEMNDLYDLVSTGAYQTQAEFNAAMAGMGIEFAPDVEMETVWFKVPHIASNGWAYYTTEKIEIPKISTKSGNAGYSGSPGGGSPSSSGGGGGGGGGNENPDRWLNPYDKFYNLTEQINEALRQREKLERNYDRILKNRWSKQRDIQANTRARLNSLKQEIAMNRALLAGRQSQVDAVLNEKFLDDDKNIRTFREFGVGRYANYNTERGTIEIDWEGLERLSGTTDTQLGGVIEDYVSRLEELQKQFEDVDKTIEDLEDEVAEILDINKEEYLSFEQRVFEAIVDRQQKIIDSYSELSDTISNNDEEVLNALSESIDLSRQIRDNTKTEEEIAQKEARLAYLRRDTSGANDLAIKQLEKELEEARQSYGDTLVDQELDRLSQASEEAAKQRERQIEIMEKQLEWQQRVGFFWPEVIDLLQNNYGELDEGISDALMDLLKNTDAFRGMSEYQQANWAQELHEQWLQSESGLASWRLSEAKAASMGQSGNEPNYSIAANQTTAGKALRYDYNRDMWMDEDEGWYTGVSYDATSNQFTYEGYSSKASRNEEEAKKTAAAQAAQAKRNVTVGSYINAGNAPIYTSAYGGSPLHQYFADDPKYLVLDDYGSSWMVRWHGLSSGITGFFRKGDVRAYKTGGLVDYTGPAWLDGTPSRPEFVLNADQTQAFMKLVDKLGSGAGAGDNYFDINIVVDELSSDYDVDKMVDRIKQKITEDAQYRNVNAINWIR